MRRHVVLEQGDLEVLLGTWQKVLGLSEWEIDVQLVDRLPYEENAADIRYSENFKVAVISILKPGCYPEPGLVVRTFPQDMEKSLLNELLRLVLIPWNSAHDSSFEGTTENLKRQMITDLTRAFIRTTEESFELHE